MKTRFVILAVGIVILCLFSCSGKTISTPEDTIKKYERLVQQMKADSISEMFTTDAEVGHEGQPSIKGRDSIYQFLSSFKNVSVISNIDSISNVSTKGDSAIVSGVYRQTVTISGKDTVQVTGQFRCDMVLYKDGNWMIRRMKTRSL